MGVGEWWPEARLEVRGNPRVDNNEVSQLRLTGGGGGGALSILDLATYHPGTNAPAARIQAMDDGAYSGNVDILTKQPPWTKPGMENSVRGTVTFLAFHESYHLGQLGYLRKFHGLDGAFG